VTFIDPFVTTGYNYATGAGNPNFASVLLPTGIGDNLFDLFQWNGSDYIDSGIDLTGGTQYFFGGGGVSRFSIRGIEVSAGLDPNNVAAFITGLTFVSAGDFASGPVALCLAGVLLTIILVARGVPGAIVISIAVITLAGLFVPAGAGAKVTQLPSSFVALPHSPAPVFLKLTFNFLTGWTAFTVALPLILTLLLVDMFDNIGTLIGVTKRAGLLSADGTLPKAGRALLADSLATIASALFGTSTVVSYIESASGVAAGGRTGLTSLTTAGFFLLALLFTPLILIVPAAATAPALVIVGIFMMQSVIEIDMTDFKVAAPAVLTIFAIPLTFSIAEGIGLGLVAAALLALGLGKPKSFTTVGYIIAGIFFLQFFRIFPFGG
jgi:AGZA family xanthine/uracil permease-like MFS transporter